MADVIECYRSHEMSFLETLADELEGTFHMIAHAGYANNRGFIKRRQKYFERRFGPFIDHVRSEVGIAQVIPAYDILIRILFGNRDSEEIIENAEEGLSYLNLGGELYEGPDSVFEEFH